MLRFLKILPWTCFLLSNASQWIISSSVYLNNSYISKIAKFISLVKTSYLSLKLIYPLVGIFTWISDIFTKACLKSFNPPSQTCNTDARITHLSKWHQHNLLSISIFFFPTLLLPPASQCPSSPLDVTQASEWAFPVYFPTSNPVSKSNESELL